jgi:hypothetical protein
MACFVVGSVSGSSFLKEHLCAVPPGAMIYLMMKFLIFVTTVCLKEWRAAHCRLP